ncbi:hypothetical protein FSARC_3488 [Fusarium sarcochroum]|uniref:Cytochrome P450 monooxygenase n=1 Tax=Fusarium sarcochroum TaxID=1208366 RepID=A0A8H4U4B7_9HYPO|nr:hypothetical protein FSARC_3488 [Fusarium sarcochroum]
MEYSTPTIAASILVLALVIRYIIQLITSPLRTIPGPVLARCTDGWYFWKMRGGYFHYANQDLHKKYGNIVRYGPDRYSFDDPEAVKVIYGLNTHFPKSSWYSAFETPGQWSTFGDRSIKRHAQTRRLYQATYAMSSLVHYESFVDECADIFTQRLEEMAKSDVLVDMRNWFQCYAFDVIGLITYRRRLGFLDRGDDVGGIVAALDQNLRYASLAGIFPSLHPYFIPIKNYLAGGKGTGRAYVLNFTVDRIREAQANAKPAAESEDSVTTEDFLAKFLAKHDADPEVFTELHVLSGCAQNMFAGSDTTAITLSAVFYYLLKNPSCMAKLRDEVDKHTAKSELSKAPTFKETQQMPYLQAVIKEALRIHPAVGAVLERVVPEGGSMICGRFFPEGTKVGINSWVAHRNTRVFGDDAEQFNPERWLVDDSNRLSLMNHYFIPFGLGSRSCLGRHVSMLEMSKLIPRIIRDFDFELDPSLLVQEWHMKDFLFVKPLDFKVRVERHGAEKGGLGDIYE